MLQASCVIFSSGEYCPLPQKGAGCAHWKIGAREQDRLPSLRLLSSCPSLCHARASGGGGVCDRVLARQTKIVWDNGYIPLHKVGSAKDWDSLELPVREDSTRQASTRGPARQAWVSGDVPLTRPACGLAREGSTAPSASRPDWPMWPDEATLVWHSTTHRSLPRWPARTCHSCLTCRHDDDGGGDGDGGAPLGEPVLQRRQSR